MQNDEEINKFTSIADQWWRSTGPFKLLHEINIPRIQFVKNHIDLKNKNILDIGCGGGILSESLAFNGANVTGIDAGFENIEIAKNHAKKNNLQINYINSFIEDYSDEEKYDAVIAMELIEHVKCYKTFIKKISTFVKPNGLIFLSTINRTILSYFGAIIGAEYIFKILPKKTHDWNKFLSPYEIEYEMRQNSLNLLSLNGIIYSLLDKQWKLGRCAKINFICVFLNSSN